MSAPPPPPSSPQCQLSTVIRPVNSRQPHHTMYQTRTTTKGSLKRPLPHAADDDHAEQDLASADPDFLALSPRQRRKVDAAFRSALREVRRKRRKVGSGGMGSATTEGTGGGFVVDDSESGGGGFLPDDDATLGGAGGFIPSPSPPTTHNATTITTDSEPSAAAIPDGFLPYSALPGIFASLGIEWDDDVLATFKGLSAASRQHGQGGGEATSWGMDDNYVDLNDFRSVVAVLMTPEPQDAGGEGEQGTEMEVEDEDDDEGDEYAQDESMDTTSDLSSDPEDDRRRRRRPGRRGQPAAGAAGADDADLLLPTSSTTTGGTAQQRKLTREEKDWVARMWETLFSGTTLGRGESTRLLGKEQVRSWAERLGMEWSDQELTEMIELFSTQPGKRGLGFDDFCNLLMQGGML